MEAALEENVFYGNNITVLKRDRDCTVYKMKDVTGEGTMTCYKVLPGIELMYNDFHMQSCCSEFWPKVEMIGIDHCREGRIEWEFRNGSYMYLEEGDLQINAKDHHAIGFEFPLSHYHGITVAIYIDEASKTLATIFDGFSVDLKCRLKMIISVICAIISVAGGIYATSTILAHFSAYSILENMRLKMADRLMKAPLGIVLNQTMGKLKSVIVDRVETIELPLAHLIPEGISNLLLPIGVFAYLIMIDWRMALAAMVTVPIAVVTYGIMIKPKG